VSEERKTDDLGGFAPTYGVELLYEELPALPKEALCAAIGRRSPESKPLDDDQRSGALAFVHTEHLVHGAIPTQCLIVAADKPARAKGDPKALEQSWSWPEAKAVVPGCRVSVLVTDLLSSSLDHRDRLELFQKVLAAVLEVAPCRALHWMRTQQYLRPEAFLAGTADGYRRLLPGTVNVRFYRISGHRDRPGEPSQDMIMDTLGLAALGLPDLQCHFRLLEARAVAAVLYSAASYLFDNGPVIESGHTIAGTNATDRWRCQHAEALVSPKRTVIDVNPGPPFAAGKCLSSY
jgi:hypothetical protein